MDGHPFLSMDGEIADRELQMVRHRIELLNAVEKWLEHMKGYTDKQYNKGDLKQVYDRIKQEIK